MSFSSLLIVGGIGLAGALGALVRYLLGRYIAERVRPRLPLGTLVINLSGAFLIGLIFALAGRHVLSSTLQVVLATGFLGGYTTFSTMAWESVQLVRGNSLRLGLFYIGGSLGLGLLAVSLGLALGGWL